MKQLRLSLAKSICKIPSIIDDIENLGHKIVLIPNVTELNDIDYVLFGLDEDFIEWQKDKPSNINKAVICVENKVILCTGIAEGYLIASNQGSTSVDLDTIIDAVIILAQENFSTLSIIPIQIDSDSINSAESSDLLSAENYQKIIYTWNQTAKDYSHDKTIQQLFEEQVLRTPNNIAVFYEYIKLSYQELNQRANQLAHYLKDNYKISNDDLIALYLDRSEWMLIAILATLKAGGAYVPIEPSYPTERIKYILDDTKAKVVLTNSVYMTKLQALLNTRNKLIRHSSSELRDLVFHPEVAGELNVVLAIDSQEFYATHLKSQSTFNPEIDITNTNLAYVIYTSGTTGKPKGVMVEQNTVINLIYAQSQIFNLDATVKDSKRFLWYANYVFDAHVWELYIAISYGHTIYLLPNEVRQDINGLANYIFKHKIHIATIPPALLNSEVILELDTLVVAGEKTAKNIMDLYVQKNTAVINAYGPTEATVCACLNYYKLNDLATNIGKPICNYTVYILDENNKPLSGGIGELYIGGIGLARGYLNLPEATTEKFIVNPFQTVVEKQYGKNARLYKTGDLARYMPDGNIEYVGRNDFQVKIRGLRIELGEIESVLSSCTGVEQVLVLMKEQSQGGLSNKDELHDEKNLVAYYVASTPLDEDNLKAILFAQLPEYMVPRLYKHLEQFPLTINGKVDRNKLLAMPISMIPEYDYTEYTNVGQYVANIWHELIVINRKIKLTDNFFGLGGHSLLITKLILKIKRQYDVTLTPYEINISGTLADLCKLIELKKQLNSRATNQIEPEIYSHEAKIYSLTSYQLSIYFAHEIDPQAYTTPVFVKVNGVLDTDKACKAFQTLIRKHQILSGYITETEGELKHHLLAYNHLPHIEKIKHDDLTKYLNGISITQFQLGESLVDFRVIQVSKNSEAVDYTVLSFTHHHIVADGHSIAVIINDYFAIYDSNDSTPNSYCYYDIINKLALTRRCTDFAKLIRTHNPLFTLPDYKYKIAVAGGVNTGDTYNLFFSNEEKKLMSTMAQQHNASINLIMLCVLYITLYKYTHDEYINMGIVFMNRDNPVTYDVVGCFANTLPFEVDKNSFTKSSTEFISYMMQRLNHYIEHSDTPLQSLIEIMSLDNQNGTLAPFNIAFASQHITNHLNQNYIIEQYRPHNTQAKFGLAFNFHHTEIPEILEVEFSTRKYDKSFIENLCNTMKLVIQEMYYQPTLLIEKMPNLNDQDFKQLIYTWNQTAVDYPQDKTIHELFEEQAARTPDNIALVYEETQLTYKELNQRSNQLAHYLRSSYQIQGDDLIALCLDSSEQLLTAILGILKAGAAYVPIDPNYPDERIAYILADTRAKVIIANELDKPRINGLVADSVVSSINKDNRANILEVLSLDNEIIHAKLAKLANFNLKLNITSNNLAYVIYTSGTTGKPKGVMVEHKNIVSLVVNCGYVSITFNDAILHLANISFDASTFEIFSALLNGAKLYVPQNKLELMSNSIYFKEYLLVNNISVLWLTKTLFDQLYLRSKEIFSSLKWLLIGGEALNFSIVRELSESKCRPLHIINGYGPTENTTFSCTYEIQKELFNSLANSVPIGKPFNNRTAYILDANLNPLPIGAVGELYVGGDGVARGYLNDPKLTNQYFLANIFQDEPDKILGENARIYKTGDLARYLPDGNIEYIGRNDFQVKIRGFRIELGEIECKLLSYPGIKQAVVLALEHKGRASDRSGHKYLVAYYAAATKLAEDDIHSYLKFHLPEYMIPVVIVYLADLPLTLSGKLDLRSLPAPEFFDGNNYSAPISKLEQEVCATYAYVLGISVDKIGRHDDFFRLGGNSILAIKLVSLLNFQFDANIKVADIFKAKTLIRTADLVEQTFNEFIYKDYRIAGANKDNLYEPFALNNVQQAYYLGRYAEYELGNVSTHLYIEYKFANLDVGKLELSWNKLIDRHLSLRTVFTDGQQRYLREVEYYKIQLNELSTDKDLAQIRQALEHKIYTPDKYPLFDIYVSKLSGCYFLHLSFDALLFDANSIQILFGEWSKVYNDLAEELPVLTISYRDYMLQISKLRSSQLFLNNREYWLNKLAKYNFEMNLPLLCKPSEVKNPRFNRLSKVIAKATWRKLEAKALASSLGMTSVVMAAYGKVLSYWSNQDRVCINLTLFNRLPLHAQINDILGDFTVLELFNYRSGPEANELNPTYASIMDELKAKHEELWLDIEHNLFDGIDFQRLARERLELSANQVIAPVVLTSVLGSLFDTNTFLDKSYLGVNYSITQTSQVWLDNKAYESAEGFVAEWDYVEQLFERSTVEQMHAHYCQLIEYLADADWESAQFPRLEIAPQDLAVIQKANSFVRPVSEETLFSYYESHAVKHGLLNNTAIIANNTSYTYAQLINESELLAKFLKLPMDEVMDDESIIDRPINDGLASLVGILSEKGYPQVVATLGVMKSSYGYLPLSVSWPIGRLDEVLETSGVKIVLISRDQARNQLLVAGLNKRYQLLIVEDIIAKLERFGEINSKLSKIKLAPVGADEVAYVIFTSGSSGKPKGVTISHKGALNTILSVNERFEVTKDDKIFALSELSFDLSVYDIFGVLAAGGTIVFPQQELLKDPGHWLDLVNKYKLTLWNTVPQLADLFIDAALCSNLDLASLRLFLLSGDWLPTNLPAKLRELNDNSRVVSLGGATEGSIWSIWYDIKQLDPSWQAIPYGVAMPNQQMYVLNQAKQHCPLGVMGEIYIGGVGVALNYWGDEEKTTASYVMHTQLGRLYKTGDLGKWNKLGYMEFLGRKDSQVKINGYRVELGEISAKLNKLPGVAESVVTIQAHDQQNYLVGYLLPKEVLRGSSASEEVEPESFKLASHGIVQGLNANYKLDLAIDEAKYKLRKSYRNYLPQVIDVNVINAEQVNASNKLEYLLASRLSDTNKCLNLASLKTILSQISCIEMADRLLPKYLYPSAGNSYGVRSYLNLVNKLEADGLELNLGYYYYNPLTTSLSAVSGWDAFESRPETSIDFVIYWPAIRPLYHAESRRFAYLEVGHMLNLVVKQSRLLGLNSVIEYHELELDNDNSLVARLLIDAKSINQQMSALNIAVSTYTKNDLVYRSADGEFDTRQQSLFEQANIYSGRLLEVGSSLITVITGTTARELIYAGMYFQELSEGLYAYNYGSCTLGTRITQDTTYAMVIGSIDPSSKGESQSEIQKVPLKYYVENYLQNELPDYMLPYDYVVLDKLPLTANGKLALNLLPKLEIVASSGYVAPRTAVEQKLAEVYAEVLNLAAGTVSVYDDFFRLGGNSITAMQAVSKIAKEIGTLKLATIYKHRSIDSLASTLSSELQECMSHQLLASPWVKVADDVFDNPTELSEIQKGIYIQSKLDTIATTYNVPLLIRLSNIDVAVLEQALNHLFLNTRIFRMILLDSSSYKLARLAEVAVKTCNIKDVSSYVAKSANFEFNLEGGLLITPEIALLEQSQDVILNLTHHHILSDANSVRLILAKFLGYYAKLQNNSPLHAETNKYDYLDYIAYQRGLLQSEEYQLVMSKLALKFDETVAIQLPKLQHAMVDNHGQGLNVEISKVVLAKLKQQSQTKQVSLYSILVTLLYHVLNKYNLNSGGVFPIGLTVANRKNGFEDAIGPFISTMPFIVDYDERTSILSNCKKSQQEIIFLNQYGDINLTQIAQLSARSTEDISELMQIMFTLHNFRVENIEETTHNVELLTMASTSEKFGISIVAKEYDEKLIFNVSYATHRYASELIANILTTYQVALNHLAEVDLNISLSELRLLSNENYQEIIYAWNQTAVNYSQNKTIHQLFEEQAARTPDNIALVYEETQLSYKELNQRSNQLAHYLRSTYQIQGDDLIVLLLDRTEFMLIAILGTLKSGAAYVPIDPSYPDKRIAYILNDTQAKVVLTNEAHALRLQTILDTEQKLKRTQLDTAHANPNSKTNVSSMFSSDIPSKASTNVRDKIEILAVDSNEALSTKLAKQLFSNPEINTSSTNLVYVIYTSGTTGTPKGVMIEHKSLVAYAESIIALLGISQLSKSIVVSDYVFDLGNTGIYPILISGGEISLTNKDKFLDSTYLMSCIESRRINFLKCTPLYFESVLLSVLLEQSALFENFTLVLGGESCSSKLWGVLSKHSMLRVISHYGPSETTVGSICNLEFIKRGNTNCIGKPLNNETAYILDKNLNPLPVNTIGELYIGGAGLARGYLNDPKLTSDKFIANPFQSENDKQLRKNIRLYKTGDLVRYLPNGEIEYIGRNDFQVKVRGYRVELGEIESLLQQHGDIAHAVVVAKESLVSKNIVAYVVSKVFIPSVTELKDFLIEKLPDYMIPTYFVFLERLPLTMNGKLDRSALPDPEPSLNDAYVAPTTDLEIEVCAIVANVLGISVDKVGRHDDFFRLGGNSILAIKLIGKLNQHFQSDLKVSTIIRQPNIAELVKVIPLKDNYQTLIKLNTAEGKPTMFMFHPGQAGCEVYAKLAEQLKEQYVCYGIDNYNLHNDVKYLSLNALANYYLSALFERDLLNQSDQEVVLLGWSLGGLIALELAAILELRGYTQLKVYVLDSIISDSELRKLRNHITDQADQLESYLLSQSYAADYVQKIVANLASETSLQHSTISHKLIHTKLVLFKAMQKSPHFTGEVTDLLFKHILQLTTNNLESIVADGTQIQLFELANSHHWNILEQPELVSRLKGEL